LKACCGRIKDTSLKLSLGFCIEEVHMFGWREKLPRKQRNVELLASFLLTYNGKFDRHISSSWGRSGEIVHRAKTSTHIEVSGAVCKRP
jgi:hypothetical protein